MKYCVVIKDRVVSSAIDYDIKQISSILSKFNIKSRCPARLVEPFFKNEDFSILPFKDTLPVTTNDWEVAIPKLEIIDNTVVKTFQHIPISLELGRKRMLEKIAARRFLKETQDFNFYINGTGVILDGSRETRNNLFQTYTIMNDSDSVAYKFSKSSTWLTLSKNNFFDIISTVNQRVQELFRWEQNKVLLVNQSNSIEELQSIDLNDI